MSQASLADRDVADLAGDLLAVSAGTLTVRRCSTGKFNTTYRIDNGPRPLVLRIAPPDDPGPQLFYEYRMMRQEPALHALVRRRTSIPVPEILEADWSRRRIDRDFLLMERLPGLARSERTDLSREAHNQLLCEVGKCLRQLHQITGDSYGYVGDNRPMAPQSTWAAAFRIMWHKLLDDIERSGGYQPGEADFLRKLLDRHQDVFARPIAAALLHMDVWEQNILADADGRLTGLIDWDRALWGDPELEFAILDFCNISQAAFWEGYSTMRDSSPPAEVRRLFYLLYEAQKYIFAIRMRRNNPPEAEAYRRYSLILAKTLESMNGSGRNP